MTNPEPVEFDPKDDEEAELSELGDYLNQLTDYEGRLARGEVQWQ